MKNKYFLYVLLIITVVFGNNEAHVLPDFLPNELLIQYEKLTENEPVGNEILQEYDDIKNILSRNILFKVKTVRPINNFIIQDMISENKTERELVSGVSGVLSKTNSNKSISNNLSRMTKIEIENSEQDRLLRIIEEIKNKKSLFEKDGYRIKYIEPNYISRYADTPNDPDYSLQWAYQNTSAEEAWEIETGNHNIKIGVIDGGVYLDHEDLVDNIDRELAYDFIDFDSTRLALIASFGWQLIEEEDYFDCDNEPYDYDGHGTHCAGIIGAVANNNVGITGVAPNISIVPLRSGFVVDGGGYEDGGLFHDDIFEAINYAVLHEIDILSMSFGSSIYSSIYEETIKNAYENGVVLIAAAGNNGSSDYEYPAAFDGVIAVANTTNDDTRNNGSSYGSWVDIAAPGTNIYSTVPLTGGWKTNAKGYNYMSGTSMATPFVAGVAGLILSKNPDRDAETVYYILKQSVDMPQEKDTYIGTGRINVLKAVTSEVSELTPLDCEISNIDDDLYIFNAFEVMGTASGDHYKLQLSTEIYDSNWVTIDSGSAVYNGVLGTIDPLSQGSGGFYLRLITQTGDMKYETQRSINISLDSLITCEISNVYDGMYIDQIFNIIGTASGDNYMLQLHPENNTGNWMIIDSGSVVKNDILGTISPCDFNTGEYMLRLTVDGYGTSNETQKSIKIINENVTQISGFPVSCYSSPQYILTEDLDYDGKKEILCFYYAYFMILKYSGENFLPDLIYYEEGSNIACKPAIGDFDNDGKKEIVICSTNYDYDTDDEFKIISIYDLKGRLLENWPQKIKNEEEDFFEEYIILDDLDNDGNLEIITNSNKYSDSFKVFAYHSDGNILDGFPVEIGEHSFNAMWPVIADIDGNGKKEIIIDIFDAYYQNPQQLIAIDCEGKRIENFNFFVGMNDELAGGDIDNDGELEFVMDFCILDDDGTINAYDTLDSYYNAYKTPIALGDITNDGNLEFFYGGIYFNEAYLRNFQGNLIDGWPISCDGEIGNCNYFANVNNDSKQDLIINWTKTYYYDYFPGVNIYNSDASKLDEFSYYNGLYSFSQLLYDDLDGNGIGNLIAFNDKKSEISAFNMQHEMNNDNCWKTIYHDNQNTNNYNAQLQDLKLFEISSMTIDEDQDTTIRISPAYLNWSNYSLDINSDTSSVSLFLNEGLLSIIPDENWYGETDIHVILSGFDYLDSLNIILNVISKNDPPTDFSLLTPGDSSIIEINNENYTDSLKLSWEKSIDVEGKSLYYKVWISDERFSFINKDSLPTNQISYPYEQLANCMFAIGIENIELSWNIVAIAGGDSTFAKNGEFSINIKNNYITGLEGVQIPLETCLEPNYPNPFNPTTIIKFGLDIDKDVSLKLYNLRGELVRVLVNRKLKAGYHNIVFDGSNLTSGMYIYRLQTEDETISRKMMLVK